MMFSILELVVNYLQHSKAIKLLLKNFLKDAYIAVMVLTYQQVQVY